MKVLIAKKRKKCLHLFLEIKKQSFSAAERIFAYKKIVLQILIGLLHFQLILTSLQLFIPCAVLTARLLLTYKNLLERVLGTKTIVYATMKTVKRHIDVKANENFITETLENKKRVLCSDTLRF